MTATSISWRALCCSDRYKEVDSLVCHYTKHGKSLSICQYRAHKPDALRRSALRSARPTRFAPDGDAVGAHRRPPYRALRPLLAFRALA